jgi:hypothetical protein
MFDERSLEWVEVGGCAEPLDGGDLMTGVLYGKCKAREDPPALYKHRAGPAGALIAALLGAGEVKCLAHEIEERHPRIVRKRNISTVDGDVH